MIMPASLMKTDKFQKTLSLLSRLDGLSIIESDMNGSINWCNENFIKITGLTEIPTGSSIADFLEDPHYSKQFETIFNTHIKANNVEFPVTGFAVNFNDRKIFIIQRKRVSDNKIFEKMTEINQDLGVISRKLEKKNKELEEANKKIQQMARIDSLTGLYNRRHFFETYNKMFSFSKRKKSPLSIIMADIDHFKKINDSKGHQTGDSVLQVLGKTLNESCRKEDIVARYGGEEFVISLLDIKLEDAITFTERLKSSFSSKIESELGFKVTLSFGVAQLNSENHPNELIKAADEKLYQAKNSGRDKICY